MRAASSGRPASAWWHEGLLEERLCGRRARGQRPPEGRRSPAPTTCRWRRRKRSARRTSAVRTLRPPRALLPRCAPRRPSVRSTGSRKRPRWCSAPPLSPVRGCAHALRPSASRRARDRSGSRVGDVVVEFLEPCQVVVVVARDPGGPPATPATRSGGAVIAGCPMLSAKRDGLFGAVAHRGEVASEVVAEAESLQAVDDCRDRTGFSRARQRVIRRSAAAPRRLPAAAPRCRSSTSTSRSSTRSPISRARSNASVAACQFALGDLGHRDQQCGADTTSAAQSSCRGAVRGVAGPQWRPAVGAEGAHHRRGDARSPAPWPDRSGGPSCAASTKILCASEAEPRLTSMCPRSRAMSPSSDQVVRPFACLPQQHLRLGGPAGWPRRYVPPRTSDRVRCAGSSHSVAARSYAASAATFPPRRCALELTACASAVTTSGSGPSAAAARCHTSRSRSP